VLLGRRLCCTIYTAACNGKIGLLQACDGCKACREHEPRSMNLHIGQVETLQSRISSESRRLSLPCTVLNNVSSVCCMWLLHVVTCRGYHSRIFVAKIQKPRGSGWLASSLQVPASGFIPPHRKAERDSPRISRPEEGKRKESVAIISHPSTVRCTFSFQRESLHMKR